MLATVQSRIFIFTNLI